MCYGINLTVSTLLKKLWSNILSPGLLKLDSVELNKNDLQINILQDHLSVLFMTSFQRQTLIKTSKPTWYVTFKHFDGTIILFLYCLNQAKGLREVPITESDMRYYLWAWQHHKVTEDGYHLDMKLSFYCRRAVSKRIVFREIVQARHCFGTRVPQHIRICPSETSWFSVDLKGVSYWKYCRFNEKDSHAPKLTSLVGSMLPSQAVQWSNIRPTTFKYLGKSNYDQITKRSSVWN